MIGDDLAERMAEPYKQLYETARESGSSQRNALAFTLGQHRTVYDVFPDDAEAAVAAEKLLDDSSLEPKRKSRGATPDQRSCEARQRHRRPPRQPPKPARPVSQPQDAGRTVGAGGSGRGGSRSVAAKAVDRAGDRFVSSAVLGIRFGAADGP